MSNAHKQTLRYITLKTCGLNPPAPSAPPSEHTLNTLINEDLAPLYHLCLKHDNALGLLPAPAQSAIQTAHKTAIAKQIMFDKIFKQINRVCRAADIPVAPLKGIHLSEHSYPWPGARPMSDLDLLVPRNRFTAAIAALRAEGFRSKLDFLALKGRPLPSGVSISNPQMSGVDIDLHHSLINTSGIRSLLLTPEMTDRLDEGVWNAVNLSGSSGEITTTLSPAHFFLALMMHHYTHNFRGLQWYIDAAVYASRMDGNDWTALGSRLRKYNLLNLSHVYLNLCASNLGCAPEELFPQTILRAAAATGSSDRVMLLAVRAGRLKPIHSLMLLPGTYSRAAAIARFLFPSLYYLETVTRKPIPPPLYLIELIKFQTRSLRR